MRKTDSYWLKKIRSRNTRDFNEFFEHFFPRLYRFAMARVREPLLAEEAVQEAMSKAVLKIDTYLGEAALFTWLCTFTRHEIGRLLKRESRHLGELVPWDNETVTAALESLEVLAVDGPGNALEKFQLAQKVRLAMSSLPGHYADVLEWRYLLGHSIPEIAEKLNKSYKATESLLSRSRNVFRDAFLASTYSDGEAGNAGGQ